MDSGESIQKLVNRGNRELMEAMREEYESHIAVLVQDKNLLAEKYTGIEIEMGQAREEYERCQSEKHLIEHDFRVALQKYELEIRKRMDAEIRLQDVNRWLDTALTELDSARHQNSHSLSLLASSQTEAEDLARTVRQQRERIEGLERDLAGLRDQALDWVQQREKIDKREADLRGQCTRLQSELDTTRSQLRDTNDHASNLSAEVVQLKQETRRLDVNLKTEAEARESASKECTLLRKRLDLSEKTVHRLEGDLRQTASDLSETALKLTSQKAQLTSALEQLKNMSERATQLEILNKDANDRLVHLETSEDKLTMRLEIDRQELERERKLRVEMQTERDSLKALLSAARYQLENTEKDITVVRRELSENSRFSNKLELKGLELQAIIKRQEQSIHSDRKLSARKLSSLEKCLQEEKASKEEAWTSAKAAERARAKLMRALREALTGSDDKGSKLREAACEIDRFQKLLQCYQQQASEQQDTLDSASKECTLLRKRLDLSEKTVHRLEGDLRQTASDLSETALKLTSQKAQLTSALEQLKNMSERATQLEILNKDANDRLVHLETSEDKLTMRLEIDRQELERERKLRVEMQTERDSLKALLSAARYQLENTEKDITVVRRELSENSRFSNKLELKGLELQAIIKRQEQSIHSDRKLSARKLSSLEKCLQEEKASKEEAWTSAKAAERARAKLMRALREALTGSDDKGSKLREAACEIDRFQKLLQCYQQQASEQQDTLDRYHATIAAFDGEKMALQAMLEAERTDAQTQSKAAENAFRSALQQHLKTIERWRMRFEDLDSSMRFAPAAEQVKALEAALIAARDLASVHEERTQALEAERDAFEQGFATLERDVLALRAELEVKSKELEESGRRTGQAELDFERAQMRSEDLAVLCMTLKQEAESVSGETARFLSHIRGHLRPSAAGILRHLRRLPEFANIQRLGFINDLLSAVEAQSSDSVGVQWTKEDARVPPDAVFAATGAQTDLTYIYLERKAPTVVDSKPRTERTVRLQKSTREAGAGDPEPSLKIKEMSVVGGVEGQQGRPGSPSQTGHGEKEHGASTLGRSGAVSAISAAASQMLNTSRRTANGKGEDRLSWLSRSKPR
eukprot:Cvel_9012.t2-p1 / transcript=Cvel_9012.t2 / gene=Cvel_9012 / organism=Chromera_velia_CCMP2878 / gene_product=Myosin heavy chain, striated muscle, putative / transcript_product=Myosin heavy chain, striated muscle, putative / location=Cvel_scaffold510:15621-20112(-) / protein_length=1105 / sequence_SO=supercontig / SO=protein_coding / is_pseudo=false